MESKGRTVFKTLRPPRPALALPLESPAFFPTLLRADLAWEVSSRGLPLPASLRPSLHLRMWG